LVTSYTRAAAVELASGGLPVPPDNLGTLHSIAFHALNYPDIAEVGVEVWNKEHSELRLSPHGEEVGDMTEAAEFAIRAPGDELYSQLQILRARLVPPKAWPKAVREFEAVWNHWKQRHGLMDFTDLIEVCLRDFKIAPGRPDVVIADEGQDLTRLQLALLRQWGRNAGHLLLAGDDDQAILVFAGAEPEALTETSGEFFRKVLSQSYRVPRWPHRLAGAWISQLSWREPKPYDPRDEDGEVRLFHEGSYRYPEPIVRDAERYLAASKTVMFLATCSYMLVPLKRVLRQRGLPFANPYRLKRRDWNPLASPNCDRFQRLKAFVRPWLERSDGQPWNVENVRFWAEWLRDSTFREGARERLMVGGFGSWETPGTAILADLLAPQPLERLILALGEPGQAGLAAGIRWWLDHLAVDKRKTMDYPAQIILHCGVDVLAEEPRLVIGTGHSVKGGEAEVVYVFPDLSASATREWEGGPKNRDGIIRLGYVMITRARESLILCNPAGPGYMPLDGAWNKVRQAQI
jgi:superfamily I DNA/RNA helicase